MQKFSDLTIIISNCLFKGSSWATTQGVLCKIIKEKLLDIEDFEYRGINCNDVRGDHNSFTISIIGCFYKFSQQQSREQMFDLEALSVSLMQTIPDLTFSEIRIEHTRHMTEFEGLQHPQLARSY